jgi:hypothetical protein
MVRVAPDRRVRVDDVPEAEDPEVLRLTTLALAKSAPGGRVLPVPAQRHRPARDALGQIRWQAVRIHPPIHGAVLSHTEVTAGIVQVWEPEPPHCVDALEWIVLTTGPIAWERVTCYTWRWLLEDVHTVLKTGGGIEVRRQQTVGARGKVLGILTPMAMRVLWLRQTATLASDTPATDVVSQEVIAVATTLDHRPGAILTAHTLWRTIASFGGSFHRKSDGPPGWQTVWKGWLDVPSVLLGVRLATRFPPLSIVLTC